MTLLAVVASVLFVALVAFIAIMWVRLIVDWVRALRPDWRPAGPFLVVAELSFAVTDPPIKLVRRIVKPVHLGEARIDFGWSIVLILSLVAMYLLGPLRSV